MPNRFFLAEAQNTFFALRCGSEPGTCDIARTSAELDPIKTEAELEAISYVLSSIACADCVEYVKKNYEGTSS